MIPILSVLFALIVLGLPIAVALGITSVVFLANTVVPYDIVALLMFSGLENFVLLALPLFMIAGEIMNRAGIAETLIELAASLVGSLRAGLAQVNVVVSMIFAEISGSSVADVACEGPIIIPQMEKRGYPRAFAAAITSSSASLAIIIPPSIPLILYGAIANQSVAKLFIAGIVPGLILSAALMTFNYGFAVRHGWKAEGGFDIWRLGRALRGAAWPLTLPVIILGGILGGVFTPTEAAAVAVAAAFFIGTFVTRRIALRNVPSIVLLAAKRSSVVLLIIATSAIFGWHLTNEGIPQTIAKQIVAISDDPYVVMFWLNLALIALGTFLHGAAIIVLVVPLVLPMATAIGYDPVHFGIVFALNVAIGQQTPPVASCLLTASAVSGSSVGEIMVYNKWFILCMVLTLQLVTYVPALSLWLPSLLVN